MKVHFYIAGIQKSGTTNLAYLLSQSSNVLTHRQTECTFYYNADEYRRGFSYLKKHYFFDKTNFDNHYVLIKHSNSFTNPNVLSNALKDNPEILFLLVFRHPVQRFYSSYLMEKTRSLYPLSLEQAVEKALSDEGSFEHQVFLKFGCYDVWLQSILSVIPEKNMELFLFEELFKDTHHHLQTFAHKYNLHFNPDLLDNLNIKNSYKEYKNYWYQRVVRRLRRSRIKNIFKSILPPKHWVLLTKNIEHFNLIEPKEKLPIDPAVEERLMNFYLPSIEKFEQMTGMRTEWIKQKAEKYDRVGN
ncbi:MAG: hypothetical protein Fur0023_08880 [Bacteroidia bacterium]